MAYRVPPHLEQFNPTDIPMYYNNTKSQLDILKEHPSYPYFDPSRVTFEPLDEGILAQYSGDRDLSILNLEYTDPTRISASDLESLGHETVHRTFDESDMKGVLPLSTGEARHGIPEVIDLLYGPIETTMNPELRKSLETSPYIDEFDLSQKGPKRAYPTFTLDPSTSTEREIKETIPRRTEHLLTYMLDDMIYDNKKKNIYDVFSNNYMDRFAKEIAEEEENYSLPAINPYGARKYWKPRHAYLGNAPGEVRRGILGLQDSFRTAALKYIDIMKKYKKPTTPERGQRADPFTGGGANVPSYSYTSTGREGYGYGLKKGGLATMFQRR